MYGFVDFPDGAVNTAKRIEGFVAVRAGVMGDFIITKESRVHRFFPLGNTICYHSSRDIPQQNVRCSADNGIKAFDSIQARLLPADIIPEVA